MFLLIYKFSFLTIIIYLITNIKKKLKVADQKFVYQPPRIEVIHLFIECHLCSYSGDHSHASAGFDGIGGDHESAGAGFPEIEGNHSGAGFGFDGMGGAHGSAGAGFDEGSAGHAGAGFGGSFD